MPSLEIITSFSPLVFLLVSALSFQKKNSTLQESPLRNNFKIFFKGGQWSIQNYFTDMLSYYANETTIQNLDARNVFCISVNLKENYTWDYFINNTDTPLQQH